MSTSRKQQQSSTVSFEQKYHAPIPPSAPMIWDLYRAQKSTGLSTARKHPETYFP
jgi:hypothetical protein